MMPQANVTNIIAFQLRTSFVKKKVANIFIGKFDYYAWMSNNWCRLCFSIISKRDAMAYGNICIININLGQHSDFLNDLVFILCRCHRDSSYFGKFTSCVLSFFVNGKT